MKMGPMDGTPEEIRGFLEINGKSLDDYLGKPEAPLENKWIFLPIVLFLIWLLLTVVIFPLTGRISLLIFLGGSAFIVWLTFAVHIRYKNGGATFIVSIGSLVLLLLAGGFLDPVGVLEVIRKLKKD